LLSDGTSPAEKELIQNTHRVIRFIHRSRPGQRAAIERCVTIMSQGMQRFQEEKDISGLRALRDLDEYCYHVAGVVGELLTELFCDYSEEIAGSRRTLMRLAVSFGQGLQMTNILKDVWDDRKNGACWLPREVFQKAGFDLTHLSTDKYVDSFGDGLGVLIGIACVHLKNALTYSLIVPRHQTGIRKFCLWAIGMAIFTLRNLDRRRYYRSGRDVKISRKTVKAIIFVTNATIRSNYLLKKLFALTTKGLPADGVSL
jgi:farnesyl-diphosphate farnesyltransferase